MLGFPREGLGWYTYEIVKHWLDIFPEIKWTLLFDRQTDYFKDNNVNRIVIGPCTSHTPSIAIWNEVSVTRWLSKNKPDLYFSPDGFIPLRSSVRCVPVVHDLAPLVYPQYMRWRDYIYYRTFQLRMIKRSWLTFTVSEFSKNEIIRLAGVDEGHIRVGYNGLQSGFLSTPTTSDKVSSIDMQQPYFIFIGSIHPRKNVFGLIKSFEVYRAQGGQADLLLAGRKAWKINDVEDLLVNSPVAKHITQSSYLESQELNGLLKNALGLVYISHYEGFGLPVLEAMHLGTPVITSSDSSMAEIGQEAVITCHPLDHKAVAKAMLSLETDGDRRTKLQLAGQHQALKFDYKTSAQKILKIMKQKLYDS